MYGFDMALANAGIEVVLDTPKVREYVCGRANERATHDDSSSPPR